MRVSNNPGAFSVFKSYERATRSLSTSMKKLSSGTKILNPSDDAAGLAISEKFRSQSKGSAMARNNIDNAIGFLKTADGWMQNVHDIMGRMHELSVQANDGTKSASDIANLGQEFGDLSAELSDIITGSSAANTPTQAQLDGLVGTINSNPTANTDYKLVFDADYGANGGWDAFAKAEGATEYTHIETVAASGADGEVSTATYDWTGSGYGSIDLTVPAASSGTAMDGDTFTFSVTSGGVRDGTDFVGASSGARGMYNGLSLFSASSLDVQVGADTGQEFTLQAMDLATELADVLALDSGNITDAEVISKLQSGIEDLGNVRATVGAQQSRLEYIRSGLQNYDENISAAESQIRDVDVAQETTAFSKFQILSQTSTAMLSQANSLPQNVLSLIR